MSENQTFENENAQKAEKKISLIQIQIQVIENYKQDKSLFYKIYQIFINTAHILQKAIKTPSL